MKKSVRTVNIMNMQAASAKVFAVIFPAQNVCV